jgi:hypothetical protein
MVALDLPSLVISLQLLSETFSSLILCGCLWLTFYWRGNELKPLWVLAVVGFLGGLAIFIRPANLLVPAVIVSYIALLWLLRRFPKKRLLLFAGIIIIFSSVLPGGFMVRNKIHTGEYIFTLKGPQNLYFYRAGGIIAIRDGKDFYTVRDELLIKDEIYRNENPETLAGAGARWTEWGLEIIGDNIGTHLFLTAKGFVKVLLGPARSLWQQLGEELGSWTTPWFGLLFTLLTLLHLGVVYALVAWGLVLAFLRRTFSPEALMCLVIFLAVIFPAAGPESYARFRLPVMPFLITGALLLITHCLAQQPKKD